MSKENELGSKQYNITNLEASISTIKDYSKYYKTDIKQILKNKNKYKTNQEHTLMQNEDLISLQYKYK